jgi:hypothetical protein
MREVFRPAAGLHQRVDRSMSGTSRTAAGPRPCGHSLIVDVASTWYPLTMKLFAARAEIDADDIALLDRQLGFTTVDEGLDLVEHAYPVGRSRRR